MKLEEFEANYRNAMDETLNQLQTVVFLLSRVETQVVEISHSIQTLSKTVEEYINKNKIE
ncbi:MULTISPECIES: hypothetical protein [Cyanophyceae]|jgi:hypothetical protein|uniref:hypothetical protein n=1 Tax=Cyanophyceae TaxID=3028117 RepID=UPI00168650ED|nr:hypothetical protein [Trichocoleus sp. FACHB-40]MBD2003651.1 hypothetical protein [Trichocoleus sp. FACHB-40]